MYMHQFLAMLPLGNNLHLQRYIQFIRTRPVRKFESNKGLERHHILPVSLGADKGYASQPENICVLTRREHFIAHMILFHAYYQTSFSSKMASTFFLMSNHPRYPTRASSKLYDRLKQEKVDSEETKARKRRYQSNRSEDHRNKISAALKGKKRSQEQKDNISRILKGKPFSEEHKTNLSARDQSGEKNPFYGRKHSEETLKKIRESRLGKHHSEETKKKMSLAKKASPISVGNTA